MRFESIHDPTDPAWAGHAELDAPWWRRPRVLGMLAGIVAIAVASLAFALGRGGGEQPERARTGPGAAGSEITTSPVSAPTKADVVRIPGDTSSVEDLEPTRPATSQGGGSGWAPVDATKDGTETGRLTGDLAGTTPALRDRLDRLAAEFDIRIEFVSGWRTRHEQARLYGMFLAGTGNLAAVPGTSRHEIGYAADVYVDGTALADYPGVRTRARRFGLHFPVAGEAWHVELIETARM